MKQRNTKTAGRAPIQLPERSGGQAPQGQNQGGQTPTAVNRVQARLQRTFNDLMKNNPEETVILDDMIDRLPGVDRMEIQSFMEKAPNGDFIAGRRGHPSRFVYGEALAKWRHQEEIRREWRRKNGRDPHTGTLIESPAAQPPVRRQRRPRVAPQVTVRPQTVGAGINREMALKVTVGDQEVSIPLKVELEQVA